jgi:hypothetical protein
VIFGCAGAGANDVPVVCAGAGASEKTVGGVCATAIEAASGCTCSSGMPPAYSSGVCVVCYGELEADVGACDGSSTLEMFCMVELHCTVVGMEIIQTNSFKNLN